MSETPAIPNTAPKKFVFVLMPFDQSFKDVYEVGIKAACRDAGAYCERVDEQIFHESILERVYNQIAKADLIVADMTGRNANVFYEVGYAHALNKKSILLTRASDDIPFDLKHYPHIVYGGSISHVKAELERRVVWYLSQPDAETFDLFSELEYFIDGQAIADGSSISLNVGASGYFFDIAVHNKFDRLVQVDKLRLALVHPVSDDYEFFVVGHGTGDRTGDTTTGDGHYISWIDMKPFEIMPDSWESFRVRVRVKSIQLENRNCSIQIRLITNARAVKMNLYVSF